MVGTAGLEFYFANGYVWRVTDKHDWLPQGTSSETNTKRPPYEVGHRTSAWRGIVLESI